MSAFELVLLVTTGDLVQQSVTQEDVSVTGACLAVGTFALLITFVSWVRVGLLEPDGTFSFSTGSDHQAPQQETVS